MTQPQNKYVAGVQWGISTDFDFFFVQRPYYSRLSVLVEFHVAEEEGFFNIRKLCLWLKTCAGIC